MLLFLKYLITQTGNDDYSFFRAAYYWKFQKECNSATDVVQYRLHATVPKYVEEYVVHIQHSKGNICSEPIADIATKEPRPHKGTCSHS